MHRVTGFDLEGAATRRSRWRRSTWTQGTNGLWTSIWNCVAGFPFGKVFDRVHHQRLMSKLAERVRDKAVLMLIGRMLKAKVVMPDGLVVSSEEGVPQGGPLSVARTPRAARSASMGSTRLLSNIVLDELDWELDRRGHRFVRYADDCNIYVLRSRAGRRVMASIKLFAEGKR